MKRTQIVINTRQQTKSNSDKSSISNIMHYQQEAGKNILRNQVTFFSISFLQEHPLSSDFIDYSGITLQKNPVKIMKLSMSKFQKYQN